MKIQNQTLQCLKLFPCPFIKLTDEIRLPVSTPQLPLAGFGEVSLKQLMVEILAAKTLGNRRPSYLKSLRMYLGKFIRGREEIPASQVTTQDVETWLKKFSVPVTRRTELRRVSAMFAFAVRRGYLLRNPCDRVEHITVEAKPPMILTPEKAETLMKMTPNSCRANIVLALYAGIRPDEILKLDWSDVNLETKTVTVNHTKTRRRRIVPLEPKAVAFLAACPLKSGKLSPSNATILRFKKTCRAALGFKTWPADVLRRSAASYLLALHKDAAKVATMLGNSPAVLLSHYHNPVTQADAERFWKVEEKAPASESR